METMDVKLNDPGEVKVQSKNHNLFFLISIFLLIVMVIVFLILFILSLSKTKSIEKEKNELEVTVSNLTIKNQELGATISNLSIKNQELGTTISNLTIKNQELEEINSNLTQENDYLKKNMKETNFEWVMFGEKIVNISYAENDKIKNSFKKGGSNYNEEIGEINNNQDYIPNERNDYDLYIPYSATQKKNQYNRIILFIHGGAWVGGYKGDMNIFCRTYGTLGFITATMGYTLLLEQYEGYSIFRIMDEITATIKNIKKQLTDRGFDGDKLEMAISGFSAGGHLSLIYPYAFAKDSVIPIKFIINYSGPVTLYGDYFIKLATYNDTLDNIDSKSIEQAKKENKVVLINGEHPDISQMSLVMFVNLFLGRKAEEDLAEMYDFEKREIIKSEKYNELYKKANYGLPVDYINETTIPTISIYGGNDIVAGIGHYAFLENKFDEHENGNLTLIYSRYATHLPFELITENGINKTREMVYSILDFSEKYFKKD